MGIVARSAPSSLLDAAHRRTLTAGIRAWLYWPVRAMLTPIAHLALHPMLIGGRYIPQEGPVIIAANHRSMLDPFVISMLSRRKIYFVAKAELFRNRLVGWVLSAVGVFPVKRGAGDRKMLATALEILRRGDCLMIFPEGKRTQEPHPGKPLRGIAKLAQRTGAAVVPVSVVGTGESERHQLGVRRIVVIASEPATCDEQAADQRRPDEVLLDRVWTAIEDQWLAACSIGSST